MKTKTLENGETVRVGKNGLYYRKGEWEYFRLSFRKGSTWKALSFYNSGITVYHQEEHTDRNGIFIYIGKFRVDFSVA